MNMDSKEILARLEENRRNRNDFDSFNVDIEAIRNVSLKIERLLFPEYLNGHTDAETLLDEIAADLKGEIRKVDVNYEEITERFLEKLPVIQEKLYKDAEAIYNGDPSAKTFSEIILSFPGFFAVFLYRIAHELYELNVPIVPRIMAEYAHEKTGIDINPGAKIGEYFCIDHGTGIVIGETAVVGDHVRMYHGVTLGVRSFRKDEEGNLLKGGKRHPNIGDHVILYANATVLGGDTYIRSNTAVPANALILHTPETFVY
ncbi:MAG: serine acetyltransferase [Erysipelotrichaceae bacterium]|nr:serine acetyltransferase [Erysipelotrichaceae bacterium]